jgi:hypothetical protein
MQKRKMERKVLSFYSNQPGLEDDEIEAVGELVSNNKTNKITEQMKSKRSKIGQIKNPDGLTDPKQ